MKRLKTSMGSWAHRLIGSWGHNPRLNRGLLAYKPISLFCVFFLCVSYWNVSLCDAQEAIPQPDGQIELTWPGVAADIYRDTSPLQGRDLAEIVDKLWVAGVGSPWTDGTDEANPTTDGTEYYYRIEVAGGPFFVKAIADGIPPSIENIAALKNWAPTANGRPLAGAIPSAIQPTPLSAIATNMVTMRRLKPPHTLSTSPATIVPIP